MSASRPNIVLVLFDDLGFADFGCYGSSIRTPHIDALARRGTRFTRFDVTPLCSPTRASLLTGRNPHAVGMGTIVQFASGDPGYSGAIPRSAAMLPRLLRDAGYGSGLFGKWHLSPPTASGPGGPYDQWPLARGFDRFFGFLPGRVHQFWPELVRDNSFLEPGASGGRHLSELLADETIAWIQDHRYSRPEDPFFAMLSLGAVHSPHHAPAEYVHGYDDAFADGWDQDRLRRFGRQRELGIMSGDERLPDSDPRIPAWESLGDEDRLIAARLMGAYAGFLEHADQQIGRVLAALDELGVADDTIVLVMSDNGATNAGGAIGTLSEEMVLNDAPADHPGPPVDPNAIGGPDYLNQYAAGWGQASNTPYRRYKHTVHNGGTRSPLIVAGPGVPANGEVEDTELYVTDIVPTLLELVGAEAPAVVDGVQQLPLHGRSIARGLRDRSPVVPRGPQYFEVGGHRAILAAGWKAVTFHKQGEPFDADRWELYHVASDPTESTDRSAEHPELLDALIDLWWSEARKYDVLPLQVRGKGQLYREHPDRTVWEFHQDMTWVSHAAAPELSGHDFDIVVDLDPIEADAEGVLMAIGSQFGGVVVYVKAGRLAMALNALGAVSTVRLGEGEHVGARRVRATFRRGGGSGGTISVSCPDLGSDVELEVPWVPGLRMFIGGAQCGRDAGPSIVPDYAAPFSYSGSIARVTVSIPQ